MHFSEPTISYEAFVKRPWSGSIFYTLDSDIERYVQGELTSSHYISLKITLGELDLAFLQEDDPDLLKKLQSDFPDLENVLIRKLNIFAKAVCDHWPGFERVNDYKEPPHAAMLAFELLKNDQVNPAIIKELGAKVEKNLLKAKDRDISFVSLFRSKNGIAHLYCADEQLAGFIRHSGFSDKNFWADLKMCSNELLQRAEELKGWDTRPARRILARLEALMSPAAQ